MKKNFVATLSLAGVLAVLTAWYFLYEKDFKKKRQETQEKQKQLVQLDKDSIQEITLERASKGSDKNSIEIVHLKKIGQDWQLLKPVSDGADTGGVVSLLNTIASTKQERVVEEKPAHLAPFGLEPPRVKLTVRKDSTSPAETVLIGNDTPVGFSAYAKLEGDSKVYRVSKSLKTSLEKPVFDLRNKDIVQTPRFEVGEMEIQTKAGKIALKKAEGDIWSLADHNLPASRIEVYKTLDAVLDLKARSIASETGNDLQNFGLKNPDFKLYLTRTKDHSRTVMWVGRTKDNVFVKREDKPIVYVVEKDFAKKIDRPWTAYQETELASFNRFVIKRIKLERNGDVVELLKEKTGWSFPLQPSVKVDDTKVDGLLSSLQDTKIAKYIKSESPETGLKAPVLVVRLFEDADNKESEKLTLKFGKQTQTEIFAEKSGLTVPFTIKEQDYRKLNLTQKDFTKSEPTKKEEHKTTGTTAGEKS